LIRKDIEIRFFFRKRVVVLKSICIFVV